MSAVAEAVRAGDGPRTAPRWSATCRPGSPSVDGAIAALMAMVEAGVDVVEVGLPYSDPLMDGPVIQATRSTPRCCGAAPGADVLRTVEAVARPGVPALVMTYWNPVEQLRRRRVRRRPGRRRRRRA